MPASQALTPRKFLVFLVVLLVLAFANPWPLTFLIGGTLAILGILIRIWGCGHLEKNQKLVTTGPYSYVKNPLYVGSFLIAIGGILAAGSPSGRGLWIWIGFTPLFVLTFFLFYLPRKKNIETGRLARKFGEAFAKYDAAVPDFIPRLSPYRSGDPQKWELARFRENHELGMDLLIVLLFTVIWFLPAYFSW